MVLKRDGRREEFSKEKLVSGLRKACQKRPISPEAIDDLAARIVADIVARFDLEVPSLALGEAIMTGLRQLDQVAYVRFASVYRRFQEATDFVSEVQKLEERP
jgi:transcriptional repressor NrdR